MVQRRCAWQKVSTLCDVLKPLQDRKCIRVVESPFLIIQYRIESVAAQAGGQRCEQKIRIIGGIDALVGVQRYPLLGGLTAQCKEFLPRHRQLPSVCFKQRYVIDKAVGTGIGRRRINSPITIGRKRRRFKHAV